MRRQESEINLAVMGESGSNDTANDVSIVAIIGIPLMAAWQFHSVLSFTVIVSACGPVFSSVQPGTFLAVSIAIAVAMWGLVGWLFRKKPAITARTLNVLIILLLIVLAVVLAIIPLVAWLTDSGFNGGSSPLRPYISVMPYVPVLLPLAAAIIVRSRMTVPLALKLPALVFAGGAALLSLAAVASYAALAVSACTAHI